MPTPSRPLPPVFGLLPQLGSNSTCGIASSSVPGTDCCVGYDRTNNKRSCLYIFRHGCEVMKNLTACHNSRLTRGPCVWSHGSCTRGYPYTAAESLQPRCPEEKEVRSADCCIGRDPIMNTRSCRVVKITARGMRGCSMLHDEITCHNSRTPSQPCVWSNNACRPGHPLGAAAELTPRCPQQRRPSTRCNGPWREIRELIRTYRCHSMYLDIGSNIGVQVRKLYEPHLYAGKDPGMHDIAKRLGLLEEPTKAQRREGFKTGREFWDTPSPVLPIFDKYFGPAPRCGVCAIGVEPNPRLSARHATVQAALRRAGVGALWLSETGADVVDGTTTINMLRVTASGQADINDVGLTTGLALTDQQTKRDVFYARWRKNNETRMPIAAINLARLVAFVHSELLRAADGRKSRIVMKIDTEGAEYKLLPHLIRSNAACIADLIFLEWHPDVRQKASQSEVRRVTEDAFSKPWCHTAVSSIDDETFLKDGKPLPTEPICPLPPGPAAARGES